MSDLKQLILSTPNISILLSYYNPCFSAVLLACSFIKILIRSSIFNSEIFLLFSKFLIYCSQLLVYLM